MAAPPSPSDIWTSSPNAGHAVAATIAPRGRPAIVNTSARKLNTFGKKVNTLLLPTEHILRQRHTPVRGDPVHSPRSTVSNHPSCQPEVPRGIPLSLLPPPSPPVIPRPREESRLLFLFSPPPPLSLPSSSSPYPREEPALSRPNGPVSNHPRCSTPCSSSFSLLSHLPFPVVSRSCTLMRPGRALPPKPPCSSPSSDDSPHPSPVIPAYSSPWAEAGLRLASSGQDAAAPSPRRVHALSVPGALQPSPPGPELFRRTARKSAQAVSRQPAPL